MILHLEDCWLGSMSWRRGGERDRGACSWWGEEIPRGGKGVEGCLGASLCLIWFFVGKCLGNL